MVVTCFSSYYEKFADGKVVCIDDEIPFDLPNTWKWCRLSSLIWGTGAGKSPNCDKRPKKDNEWGVLTTTAIQYCDFLPNGNKVLPTNYIVNQEQAVKHEDLLITRAGPRNRTGIVCVVNKTCNNLILSDKTVRIEYVREYCNPYYLMYALNSPTIHDNVMAATVGMAASQVNISQNSIQNISIPLPPYKEQKKIVNRLNTVLPYLKKYSTVKEQQDKLNENIGSLLKKSILQEAIQGRLVPQNASEEPASILLQRIKEEKQRLVKEGKLKKKDVVDSTIFRSDDNRYYEKKGKEIICIDEEIPFEIPESWEWYRMGTIGIWGAGSTPAKGNPNYYGGNILWLRTGELNNSVVYDTEIKITQKALEDCSLRMNKIGDVMIAMYGATIGKVAIAGAEMTTNQACCACTPIGIFNWYLFYFLMASQQDFIKKGEGGAQPNISREKLISHMIPIPPLAEQRRIVETLKILLNKIKGN